ncbi:ClpP/crotonase-like domain-containing protein [Cunninghamella echinulata]|nr:ClpP/crotonase-like domain-containing protein [Cunninghamella echinulata]
MSAIPTFKNFETTLFPSGVFELAFNRPHILNALSEDTYREWLEGIQFAAKDDRIKVVVLTGRGKYYSSGAELRKTDFNTQEGNQYDIRRRGITKSLVTALIDFPKLLIAAVNGPSYGFATTSLALCDVVYASTDSNFTTPFMKLAFCAEACSSYTFPKIMGTTRANEMLLMGRTISVAKHVQGGFVSRTFPKETIREEVLKIAEEAAQFSVEAIKATKKLVRDVDRDLLHQVNEEEMKQLHTQIRTPESIASIASFVDAAEKRRAERKANKSKL